MRNDRRWEREEKGRRKEEEQIKWLECERRERSERKTESEKNVNKREKNK